MLSTKLAKLARGKWASRLLKCGAALFVLNEIRGAVLAGPVLYALWQSGGTMMAVLVAVCTLGGIALSVLVPLFMIRAFSRPATPRSGQ